MAVRISLSARARVTIAGVLLAVALTAIFYGVANHAANLAMSERQNVQHHPRTCVNTSPNPEPLARCLR